MVVRLKERREKQNKEVARKRNERKTKKSLNVKDRTQATIVPSVVECERKCVCWVGGRIRLANPTRMVVRTKTALIKARERESCLGGSGPGGWPVVPIRHTKERRQN